LGPAFAEFGGDFEVGAAEAGAEFGEVFYSDGIAGGLG